jgi:AcrR family transcriptional regulator
VAANDPGNAGRHGGGGAHERLRHRLSDMGEGRQARTFDAIIRVVEDLLESEGYDAVQLRVVAERARVSLTTIYKFFPTRDDLIITALGQWMEANCYSRLMDSPSDASLYEAQLWIYRRLFEPWQRNPRILEAYYRARTGPGGERLDMQGWATVGPLLRAPLDKLDPNYADDVALILHNMVNGVIERFAIGDLPVTDILPVIERTLFRLSANNEPLAAGETRRTRRIRRPRRSAGGR